MFNLLDIFGKKKDFLTKEEIAAILKTSPEALRKFEESYKINILDNPSESDNFFDINSRQMAEDMGAGVIDDEMEDTSSLVDRIVDEFLSETKVYTYTRKSDNGSRKVSIKSFDNLLPDKYIPVSNEDINKFELKNRPQCTKYLQKRDMPQDSCDILLNNLMNSKNPKLPMEKRRLYYNLFRQGLDILDIDPITYEIIGTNPISIGFWLPKIIDSVDNQGFFKIPSTTIIKVPMNILQLTSNLLEVIKDINLSGQWSIDIMQNGDEFFIIDMALAQNSAFYERIPKELKNPTPENWIPDLSSKI